MQCAPYEEYGDRIVWLDTHHMNACLEEELQREEYEGAGYSKAYSKAAALKKTKRKHEGKENSHPAKRQQTGRSNTELRGPLLEMTNLLNRGRNNRFGSSRGY